MQNVNSPGGEFYPSIHLAFQVPPALSVPQARSLSDRRTMGLSTASYDYTDLTILFDVSNS